MGCHSAVQAQTFSSRESRMSLDVSNSALTPQITLASSAPVGSCVRSLDNSQGSQTVRTSSAKLRLTFTLQAAGLSSTLESQSVSQPSAQKTTSNSRQLGF